MEEQRGFGACVLPVALSALGLLCRILYVTNFLLLLLLASADW